MKQINKLVFFTFFFLLLFSSLALALSKPVTGTLLFEDEIIPLTLDLYVKSNFIGQEEICTIHPSIATGSDGSFSTNLNNLVLKEHPNTRCGSFWKMGDSIWYEINYNGILFSTDKEQIQTGTGLQRLHSLSIFSQKEDLGNFSGGSTDSTPSGSGVGFSGSTDLKDQHDLVSNEGVFTYQITLTLEQEKRKVLAHSMITSDNKGETGVFKTVLFSLPNNYVVDSRNKNIELSKEILLTENFLISTLSSGRYYVQSFLYLGGKLVATSPLQKFFTQGNDEEIKNLSPNLVWKSIEMLKSVPETSWILILYVVILVLIFIIFILVYKRREGAKENKNKSKRKK